MERKGKFEDAQALKKHLKIEESSEEEIELEEKSIQTQDENKNEVEHEDIFCNPEDKVWEAKKKQIDARVAAWKTEDSC